MQNLIKLINIDPLQDGQGRKMLEEDRSLKREEETTSWSTTTTTAITTTGMCIRWNDGASGRDLFRQHWTAAVGSPGTGVGANSAGRSVLPVLRSWMIHRPSFGPRGGRIYCPCSSRNVALKVNGLSASSNVSEVAIGSQSMSYNPWTRLMDDPHFQCWRSLTAWPSRNRKLSAIQSPSIPVNVHRSSQFSMYERLALSALDLVHPLYLPTSPVCIPNRPYRLSGR
ncbi:unnamed protein product [Nesidiocoris tenuis]|uniref:Uncharacterized protein n=1 Tax=Nesidiocoris tenuis TaxID=355587 RepID=A0A6H5H4P7_9HEMI|nr:unnamed protein product [Nesidiocoris tenuis]